MIKHFLQTSTQKFHEELVGSIIFTNKTYMLRRLKTLEAFILIELGKLGKQQEKIPSKITMLMPHMETFCKYIRLIGAEIDLKNYSDKEELIFKIEGSQIENIVDIFNKCHLASN